MSAERIKVAIRIRPFLPNEDPSNKAINLIPEDEKPNILKELYSEGYSEEYLFPGYDGVKQTIENRVKLDQVINIKNFV